MYLPQSTPEIAWEAARALQYLYPLIDEFSKPVPDRERLLGLAYAFSRHENEVQHQDMFGAPSMSAGTHAARHSIAQSKRASKKTILNEGDRAKVIDYIDGDVKKGLSVSRACKQIASQLRTGTFSRFPGRQIEIESDTLRKYWSNSKKIERSRANPSS